MVKITKKPTIGIKINKERRLIEFIVYTLNNNQVNKEKIPNNIKNK